MPITAQRMVALISAARDFERALDTLVMLIHSAEKTTRTSAETPAEALALLIGQANAASLLQFPTKSPAIIAAEFLYFKRNLARLRANARWQEKQRAKAKGLTVEQLRAASPQERDFPAQAPRATRTQFEPQELDADTKRQIDREVENSARSPDEVAKEFFALFEDDETEIEAGELPTSDEAPGL